MNNFDYQSNSHKSKEEQAATTEEKKRVEKVVTNEVKVKKKSGLTKFANTFVSEDINSVKSYVCKDVLIPAAKKLISDVVTNGIDMLLYGGSGKANRGSSGSKVSYNSIYDNRNGNRVVNRASVTNRFDYDDLSFNSRGDAEMVREQLDEMIARYGVATVADFYDAAGLTAPYTANRFGWTNIRDAEVIRGRDGFILKLPRAMAID